MVPCLNLAACVRKSLARPTDKVAVATIRFSSSRNDTQVTVDVPTGASPTLLAVAREHRVPVPFDCRSGACGACLVRVETLAAGSRPVAPLTDDERLVLTAARWVTAEDIAAAERRGVSPKLRLACQYRLGDEEIAVSFESELGGN
jgi:ferredoxin